MAMANGSSLAIKPSNIRKEMQEEVTFPNSTYIDDLLSDYAVGVKVEELAPV